MCNNKTMVQKIGEEICEWKYLQSELSGCEKRASGIREKLESAEKKLLVDFEAYYAATTGNEDDTEGKQAVGHDIDLSDNEIRARILKMLGISIEDANDAENRDWIETFVYGIIFGADDWTGWRCDDERRTGH